MQYFLMRLESDPKVIGVKNGVTQVEIDRRGFQRPIEYDRIVEFFAYSNFWKKSDFAPTENFVVECARLLRGAILTDFISFNPDLMGCPFIISDRVKATLGEYNLQQHYYFPVQVWNRDNPVSSSYHLMYCPYMDFDIIDFGRSTFYFGNSIVGKRPVEINTKEEYLEMIRRRPTLNADRVYLSDVFNKELDFFAPRLGGDIFVSQRLKEQLLLRCFSGVKFPDSNAAIFET